MCLQILNGFHRRIVPLTLVNILSQIIGNNKINW